MQRPDDPPGPAEDRAGPEQGEITRHLEASALGDARASERAIELIYPELRRLAAGLLRSERPDHTLQPTALVHEAWMKLSGQRRADWESRAHFLSLAAVSMRRVLLDHARGRGRGKRGAGAERRPLGLDLSEGARIDIDDLLDLSEGLEALARESERGARLVELRFFAGLTEAEAAHLLGVSRATAEREWRVARAWLSAWMSRGGAT